MILDLVLLAAGRGSRFGGFKQTAPVGPTGQSLCEYTVFDALEAGFGRVVLVAPPDRAAELERWAGERFGRRLPVVIAVQERDGAPPERERPWGTGHAVLAAAPHVGGPFAVANADDHYGPWAFVILARFLTRLAAAPPNDAVARWAMVGFPLLETLPASGTVSRAICRVASGNLLASLDEHPRVERRGDSAVIHADDPAALPSSAAVSALVSLNAWAFTPAIFPMLADGFARFRGSGGLTAADEFRLPVAVAEAIDAGLAQVRVLPGADEWFGLTNPDDVARVQRRLADLVAAGRYPADLWT